MQLENRMKWILFVLTYVFTLSNGATQELQPKTEFKLIEMRQFLEKLKLNPVLPTRNYSEDEVPKASNQPVSLDVKEIFQKVEEAIFGRQGIINIKTCGDCEFEAFHREKAIYVQPSSIEEIRKKYGAKFHLLLQFILAHEIAHFVSESSIDRNGRSINGYQTLTKDIPFDPNANVEVIKRTMSPIAFAHAEVDIFALLILRSMGTEMPTVASQMLADFVNQAHAIKDPTEKAFSIVEMDTRFHVMQEYLTVIWTQ